MSEDVGRNRSNDSYLEKPNFACIIEFLWYNRKALDFAEDKIIALCSFF